MRRCAAPVVLSLAVLTLLGCSRYQRKPLSFRMPSEYANHRELEGALLAAEAVSDRRRAREAFGFDIIGAGVLPVQVVISNESASELRIVPEQTFLRESKGEMWAILPTDLARERIESKTAWGELGARSGRGAVLGGLGGAIVGAAVGVVTGDSVTSAAGTGLVVGGAGGTVIGGADALTDQQVGRRIARDLRDASLQNKAVAPGELGHGVLFFPAEATGELRLKLRVFQTDTGRVKDLDFAL